MTCKDRLDKQQRTVADNVAGCFEFPMMFPQPADDFGCGCNTRFVEFRREARQYFPFKSAFVLEGGVFANSGPTAPAEL
jgi:hypothetical protein